MAKKVRKDGERKEEKKVVFEPPEFDEREYLTEQIRNIKLTMLFIAFGIPMGAIWAYISVATGTAILGFALCFGAYAAGLYGLRYTVGIDLLSEPKKVLASTFMMFIFTCLAFSVLFSNPPVNDVTDPSITDEIVAFSSNGTTDGKWEMLMRHKSNLPQNSSNRARFKENPDQKLFLIDEDTQAKVGDELAILVRAADAAGLKGVWIQYGYDNVSGTPHPMERIDEARWTEVGDGQPYEIWGENYYEIRIPADRPGNLYFLITVEDNNGLKRTFETATARDSIDISD